MPWTSSHLSFEAARTKPSKLPRGCSPCPPQLAADRNGTLTRCHTGERALCQASSSGCDRISSPNSARFSWSSWSESVSSPHTATSVRRLRGPRSPRPYWTVFTCMSYQFAQKVQRLQRGRVPLVDGVIGDAAQADLAARPGLHARPLDALVQVLRLARREMLDAAGWAAGAARVDPQTGVALRHPFLGVDDFPVLVFVRRARGDLGMLADHALPGARVAVLEGEPLRIGPVAKEDRVPTFHARAEQVGAQHQPVVHDDRDVPVDAHAVAELALGRPHARLPSSARFELARRRVSTREESESEEF